MYSIGIYSEIEELGGHNVHGIGNRVWWSEKVAAEVLHKWNLEANKKLEENKTDRYGLDSPVYIQFQNIKFDQGKGFYIYIYYRLYNIIVYNL